MPAKPADRGASISIRLFDTDAQRRSSASLRSSPLVAGQLRRWASHPAAAAIDHMRSIAYRYPIGYNMMHEHLSAL
jgi:hypothetical protein